jgi:hypothetical protein
MVLRGVGARPWMQAPPPVLLELRVRFEQQALAE